MASSGTHNFTLDIADVIEEAYERIGSELRTGYDYRTARRSLDLLMLEWQNKGLNLWKVKNASLSLTAGTGSYALPAERVDVIEGVLRTDEGTNQQTDLHMDRISVSNWARQTNKLQQGRPTQFYIEQAPTGITLRFWQVPDKSTYVFNYWYMERIEDSGKPASNNVDVPSRFLPPLVSGLAYYIALKKPEASDKAPAIYQEYERQWDLAADSAREKASFQIKPGGYS